MIVHLVSALSARLPAVWSAWWWVVRICVSRQPFSFSAAATVSASGASMEAVRPALGIVDQHAIVVGEAREIGECRASPWAILSSFRLLFRLSSRTLTGDVSNSTALADAQGRLRSVIQRPLDAARRRRPSRLLQPARSGGVVRRLLTRRIRARWRNAQGRQLMGLGFAVPYIGMFRGEASRLGALMPASQGALVWPASGKVLSVMVDGGHAAAGRCLGRPICSCVHCLEVAERAGPLLREMWRVLAPEGRLLIVVPNRRGVWARLDTTPFGHGRPYSRGQLERLLTDALFTPAGMDVARSTCRRSTGSWLVRWATAFERVGARLWPGFAGVIIVEARKELMGALPKGKPVKGKTDSGTSARSGQGRPLLAR